MYNSGSYAVQLNMVCANKYGQIIRAQKSIFVLIILVPQKPLSEVQVCLNDMGLGINIFEKWFRALENSVTGLYL